MSSRLIALAVTLAVSSVVVAAQPSAAQDDGVHNDNVTVTTSCTVGVLSEDGKYCIVPRLDADPSPAGGGVAAPVEAPIPTFTG